MSGEFFQFGLEREDGPISANHPDDLQPTPRSRLAVRKGQPDLIEAYRLETGRGVARRDECRRSGFRVEVQKPGIYNFDYSESQTLGSFDILSNAYAIGTLFR
jgi:hypothetical protein